MNVLDNKTSVCESCGDFVQTTVLCENNSVYYEKECPKCGKQRTLISIDLDYYQRSNSTNQKELPFSPSAKTASGCPYDCGLCEKHQQKVYMAMVETTDDCNVRCKTCIAGSCPGGKQYISVDELKSIINTVKTVQNNCDLLMLSGGEPTIHPEILEMIDCCQEMGVQHTMIISNGLRIANDINFVNELSKRKSFIEIYLQFDSLNDTTLRDLRGDELTVDIRKRAVDNLERVNIHYTLVCIIKKSVNDNEIKDILEYAMSKKYARGVTFQPLKDIGRGNNYEKYANYITLSEVRKLIAETGIISEDELIPHPCNGNCICIGYLNQNRTAVTSFLYNEFEHRDSLKDLMYYLPNLDTDNTKYCELFRITVVSFLDKYNFTLEDVKKCGICFVSSDGRLVPFDTHYSYN